VAGSSKTSDVEPIGGTPIASLSLEPDWDSGSGGGIRSDSICPSSSIPFFIPPLAGCIRRWKLGGKSIVDELRRGTAISVALAWRLDTPSLAEGATGSM
jgi:hypothetical protein